MRIQYILEKSEGIDVVDLIGNITISDSKNKINIEFTYLDSWFCALVEGLLFLKKKKNSSIDLIQESFNITFQKNDSNIKILIPESQITFDNIDIFEKELFYSITKLFKELEGFLKKPLEPTLEFLNSFLNKESVLDKELPQPVINVWDFE